ncbi:hypothetical protein GALMADRAFT_160712 [Galerina marginata CBS 339.88]|uniref:Uncharacterized protein n=1 Tax=Galerina marginata (strain CBS 339.88) TaxID=685588 RepID=A0A067SQ15_GALM3|nr:hypothetical protein GALMADRAFT_160712 [Galerina marginata CBS 339.88]
MSGTLTHNQGVDDPKTSIISYSGSWTSVTNDAAYGGTLHQTTATGASATLAYTGSLLVNIVGGVQPCGKNISGLVEYQVTMDGVVGGHQTIACTSQFQIAVALYSGSGGTVGVNARHAVTLTNLGPTSAPLLLDHFDYIVFPTAGLSTPSPAPTTGSSDPNASPSAGAVTQTVATEFIVTTVNAIATTSAVLTTLTIAVESTGTHSSLGGGRSAHVIGPVIGGVSALVVIAATIFLILRRRRQKLNSSRFSSLAEEFSGAITPFNLNSHHSESQEVTESNICSQLEKRQQALLPHSSSPSNRLHTRGMHKGGILLRSERLGPGATSAPVHNGPSTQVPESSTSTARSYGPLPQPTTSFSHDIQSHDGNIGISGNHDQSGTTGPTLLDVPPSYESVNNPIRPLDAQEPLQDSN